MYIVWTFNIILCIANLLLGCVSFYRVFTNQAYNRGTMVMVGIMSLLVSILLGVIAYQNKVAVEITISFFKSLV